MKPLQDYLGQELVWSRIKPLQPHYELRAGDAAIARLTRGLVSTKGDIQIGDGHWTIKREGMLRTRLVIREFPSNAVVATMPWAKSGPQVLELGNQQFHFAIFGVQAGHLNAGFLTPGAQRLVSVQSAGVAGGHKGLVTIEPAAHSLPDLPLLLAVNWYALNLAFQDAVSKAGAMGGAGGAAGAGL